MIFFLFVLFIQSVFSEDFFQVPNVFWLDTQSRFTEITLEMMGMIYDEDYKDESFNILYGGGGWAMISYPELSEKRYLYNLYDDLVSVDDDTTDRSVSNFSADMMLFSRFKYLAFAINYMQGIPYDSTGPDDRYPYYEFILNTGFTFISSFGSLGGYIGVDYRGEHVENIFDIYKFNYWILPSLGLTNYPVIGKILKTLSGHINIMESSVKGYSGRLTTQSFDIGKITISSMDYYYKKEPFNSDASHEVYGARIGINDVILFEGGFQKYFDIIKPSRYYDDLKVSEITGLDFYYKDSFFLNLAYSWINTGDFIFDYTKTTLKGDWSSRYFPFPKLCLDMEFSPGYESMLLKWTLELFLSKDLIEFTMSFACTWIVEGI
jgi:hypothetical protein